MTRIKVLQIIGSLDYGGAEKMAASFIKYIDREKFELEYLVFGKKIGIYEEEINILGGKIIRINEPQKSYIQYIKNLTRIYREGKYDVIHSHTMLNNGMNLMLARRYRIRNRISHIHSTATGRNENIIYKFYKKFSKIMINLNSTELIACGEDAGKYVYGENFLNKGIILRNAINTEKYKYNLQIRNDVRREFNIEDEFLIGHIGRMVEVKNQLFLLDIMHELNKFENQIKLIIVGDGELQEKIVNQIKEYKLENKVILAGNRNDVDKIIQGIDMVVFPSLYEGLPVVLVEAQTAGVKCIVSTGVTKEAKITDLVEYISLKKEKREWIEEIEKNKGYTRKDRANEMVKKGYDIKKSIKNLECIYEVE